MRYGSAQNIDTYMHRSAIGSINGDAWMIPACDSVSLDSVTFAAVDQSTSMLRSVLHIMTNEKAALFAM